MVLSEGTLLMMAEFSSSNLSNEEEEEMKRLFTMYDVDENGMLELDELQKMFANFNVIALKEDLEAFFDKVSFLFLRLKFYRLVFFSYRPYFQMKLGLLKLKAMKSITSALD